jgi:hypothetical protein
VIWTVFMGRSLASGATDVIVRPESKLSSRLAAMAAAGFSEALHAQLNTEEEGLAVLARRAGGGE